MADASATIRVGELPDPDYVETAEDDSTLQVPVIIHYDDWRSSDPASDDLPQPPPELLANDDVNAVVFPEPPPDYDPTIKDDNSYPGLIPPHKLPNPVLESRDHKQIAKDIKFNAKHGINVLNTKPELEKEFQRRRIERQKKDDAEQQRQNRNSFEQKLDLRKDKLNSQERDKILENEEENQSELARIHNKIKGKAKEPQ